MRSAFDRKRLPSAAGSEWKALQPDSFHVPLECDNSLVDPRFPQVIKDGPVIGIHTRRPGGAALCEQEPRARGMQIGDFSK